MNKRLILGLAGAAIALLGLTACANGGGAAPATTSSSTSQGGLYGGSSPSATAAPSAPAAGATATSLSTKDTSLGAIVVDGTGMTVYVFDKDTQGATSSSCTGECAAKWPAVHGDASATLDGVQGRLGSITGVDGQPQLTLNGWPLYSFAGDQAAGDVNGQGVGGVWWVLSPSGTAIGK